MSTAGETRSPDGHEVALTMVAGSSWQAVAECAACPWEGSGWVVFLEQLAVNHELGTDGPRGGLEATGGLEPLAAETDTDGSR